MFFLSRVSSIFHPISSDIIYTMRKSAYNISLNFVQYIKFQKMYAQKKRKIYYRGHLLHRTRYLKLMI
eukprot:UN23302